MYRSNLLFLLILVVALPACQQTPVVAERKAQLVASSTAKPRLGIPEVGSARAAYQARTIELHAPVEVGTGD